MGLQRHADPVQGRGADQIGFAAATQLLVHLRRREQRLSRPKYVLREAALELVTSGGRVVLVYPVGKAQEPRVGIVQGDVQIFCGHQLADDVVDGAEQLRQVLGGVRGF